MVHTPKRISSSGGLGLNTKKELEFLSDTLAIGRETWGKLDMPWQEGGTIIAEEGYVWLTRWEANKPYIITKFYNANGQEVGMYCDVAKPVRRTADGFEFDDLYLDVWRVPGEKPVLLDEDELAEALAAKYVTQQEANAAYVAVEELLAILDSGIVQLHSLNSQGGTMNDEQTNSKAMTTTVEERDIVLERTFDAPRQQVFEAYTDPEKIVKWWGPNDWLTEVYKMEVKPGGVWHYCMRGPENKESWGKATYHEVKAPERLKYTDAFSDAEGRSVKDMPETLVTVNFVDFEGKTRLTSRVEFASTADLENVLAMGMIQGIDETWDRLATYLSEESDSLHPSM